jgi:hypothetical protein
MQAQMMAKIKGNIIETYHDIETNTVINQDAFQKALKLNVAAQPKRKKKGEPKPVPGAPRTNIQ